ncbi:hypothetical protein QCA50_018330 [Cerrena zonata]|uniref:COPA/B second beta-propeller domain-containing protein n=1 Tax=Cerrena zonata TaxID=2478898 RepID=A0AAW0FEK6_9APHY
MDSNNKLITAKNSEVFQSIIKPNSTEGLKDGDSLHLQQRELGSIEIFPQSLAHSPNSRYAAVCGDGEYIIYTALAWRSKTYGKALDFAWNTHDFTNATTFAIRESKLSVKVFKNFQEHVTVELVYEADKIFPGNLLSVKSAGCLSFYDWESGKLVRRVDIDEEIQDVVWSDNGELLAIVTTSGVGENSGTGSKNDETYFLSYDQNLYEEALNEGSLDPEEGAENAFDVLYTLPTSESILFGKFIGDVFIYTTSSTNRLNYFVGGEVINLGHFDHKYYIVGYKAQEAEAKGKYNIALQSWWLTGNKDKCLDLLIKSERYTEAAFLGTNYSSDPAKVAHAVKLWKKQLNDKERSKVSERLIEDFSSLNINGSSAAPGESLIDLEEPKINGNDEVASEEAAEEAAEEIAEEVDAPLADSPAADAPAADAPAADAE